MRRGLRAAQRRKWLSSTEDRVGAALEELATGPVGVVREPVDADGASSARGTARADAGLADADAIHPDAVAQVNGPSSSAERHRPAGSQVASIAEVWDRSTVSSGGRRIWRFATSRRLRRALTMVPDGGPDVCPGCRGAHHSTTEVCENCLQVAEALGRPALPVRVLSLYARPSLMREWLTNYKEGDATAARQIATIWRRHFRSNRSLYDGAEIGIVVPSTLRAPPHPLHDLLQQDGSCPLRLVEALRRTPAPLAHNAPNAEAFEAVHPLRGVDVVLFDDVYTTGARAQSAALAVERAGGTVVEVVVLARRYNPSYSELAALVFARQRLRRYRWRLSSL